MSTIPLVSHLNENKIARWAAITLAVLTIVTLAFRYALPVRDGDLWWHMLYGKYFLENHTLIADHTIFSWTPSSNDRIYCTWLPDIFFYLLHKASGLPGLFVFRYLSLLTVIAGCFFYARKLRVATQPLTWLICLNALLMAYTAAFLKPEIFSFVFMTLSAWNWWYIRSSGEKAWRNAYLFPLIMLLWVNSHGGFVFGAVFYLFIALGELLNTWFAKENVLPANVRKHLAIAFPLAALTLFLTPYHYHYPLQLVSFLQPSADNMNYVKKIAAYISPFAFEDTYNLALCADLAIALLLLLFFRNFKHVEWSALLANLVFAFLFTRFFRTTFYWAPIFLFTCLNLLSQAPLIPKGWKNRDAFSICISALIIAGGGWLAGNTLYKAAFVPEKYLWMGFGISEAHPVAEAEYIKKYFPDKRIGNTYDQGAYLLWKLWPENKVFFDSRHFPYRAWSDDFFSFTAGEKINEFTSKYPCDIWCIGMPHSTLALGLLLNKEWKLAFYGKNSSILVRSDIDLPKGAPRVSSNITDLKNLQNTIGLFQFVVHVGDWQTAEKLLTAMHNTFQHDLYQNTLRYAEYLFNGMQGFQNNNYKKAATNLGVIQDSSTYIRFVLTSCYQYLTQEAWTGEDKDLALEYALKAYSLVPDNPYSLFNIGVIGWQKERERAGKSPSTKEQPSEEGQWVGYLQKFLNVTENDNDFTEFRTTAAAILDGHYEKPFQLLIPAEPTSKKLFVESKTD